MAKLYQRGDKTVIRWNINLPSDYKKASRDHFDVQDIISMLERHIVNTTRDGELKVASILKVDENEYIIEGNLLY